MKRWPIILLIISLIANIFLIGAIGGGVWRWSHVQGLGLRGGWRMRAADSLPAPQADAFRHAIRGTIQAERPVMQAGRAARAEAARLFVQPKFDAAAVNAQLDRARAADTALRAALEHQVIGFAAGLPQDQRAKMVEALKQGPLRESRGRPPR
jgi:uncharacterized membrane protein